MRDIRPATPKPQGFIPPELEKPVPAEAPESAPVVVPKRLPGSSVPVTNVHVPRTAQKSRPLFAPRDVFNAQQSGASFVSKQARLGHKERKIALALLGLVVLAGGLAAYIFLPKASITLVLATAPLLVDQQLTLQADAGDAPAAIPGTAYMREVKVEGDSAVTSREIIGVKTKGEVTIINRTFDEQKIKENSRLVTDDGKLFYMLTPAFIPAASGSAVSSAQVTVEAAVAGPESNIDKQRLNFAALDKSSQSLVYAEVTAPLTGGSGEAVAVVKEEDIERAKAVATQAARLEAEQTIRPQLPAGWSLLEESWQETPVAFAVDKTAGEQVDNLHYAAQVTVRVMAYEQKILENHLQAALEEKLDKDYMLFPGSISYTKSVNKIDWEAARGVIDARVTHTTIPRISLDALRDKLAGLDANQAKTYLAGLPGVKSASVEVWPFWATAIPRIQNRVAIDLQSDRN